MPARDPAAPVDPQVVDPRWYARLYDDLGARYDDFPFTRGTEQEVGFLCSELGLEPSTRVLDVGCGSGRHAVELAARALSVTGVDLSLRLLELGLARARARGVLVNLIHADARDLDFHGTFDVALSLCEGAFGLLESDSENRRVLDGMRRSLRPGGWLALNALNRAHQESRPADFPGHDRRTGWTEHAETMTLESGRQRIVRYRERAFHAEELGDLLRAAGFAVRSVYGCRYGDFGRHAVEAGYPELLAIAVVV
jgi:SAM-dependent methyltransferase